MSKINQPHGYMGKILWCNLTTKEMTEEIPDESIYKKYLGGYGLGVYYIYKRMKPNCDPLGPENILGFMPGLFTGSPAPYTGRFMVCGKSPLTGKGIRADKKGNCSGGWGDSNSGGFFGPAIKRAGYDGIFVTGASEKPVYILIEGDKKEIRDASELWGQDAIVTDEILKKKHQNANVVAIGKAGENQSLIAGIVNDGGRLAARSGLGAVMGAKNLKAICLKGRIRLTSNDKEEAKRLAKLYRKELDKRLNNKIIKIAFKIIPYITKPYKWMNIPFFATKTMFSQLFHDYGTPFFYSICSEIGDTPIKNFKGYATRDHRTSVARKFASHSSLKYKTKSYGCYGCPVQCGAIMKVPELGIEETHRPEYETLAAFGGLLTNSQPLIIFEINEYLNREGMDTISAGVTIAFVMECVEKNLLKQEDFKCKEFPNGFLPSWGKTENIMPLLRLIVNREGIGDLLAKGVKGASKEIKGSEEFAISANGQELPMHDPRGMKSLALTFITDPTPGRHTAGGIDFAKTGRVNSFIKGSNYKNSKNPTKKGKYSAEISKGHQSFNSLGFCEFAKWCNTYPLFELIEAVFGWKMDLHDYHEIGWRIQTLRQMFNAREGAIRLEIPKRMLNDPPMKKGPLKNKAVAISDMVNSYFKEMGFNERGIPKEETLKKLGLDFCIKDLKECTGAPNLIFNEYLIEKSKK